ncbi:MAG: bactofilin family protein [Planctomycetota bacterium]
MRLGSDCELNGNLVVAGDVSFAGRLHGHIRSSGNADVSATARIAGSVRGHDVRLAGLVEGDVISTGVLTVEKSGRVLGEIYAESICIEPGANLDGPIHLGGTSAARGDAAFKSRTQLDASSSTVRVHRTEDHEDRDSTADVAGDPENVASLLAETDAIVSEATTDTANFARVSTAADESAENDLQSANMRILDPCDSNPDTTCEISVRPIRMQRNAGFFGSHESDNSTSGNMRFEDNGRADLVNDDGGRHQREERNDAWASGEAAEPSQAVNSAAGFESFDREQRRDQRSRSRGEEALRRRLAAFEARFRRSGTVAVIGQQTQARQAVQAG